MAVQMAIPFAVDATGAIAVVTDPVQSLGDRVRALAATYPGERVMRSTLGVAVANVLFDWDSAAATDHLTTMVQQAVAQWEPSARVLSVSPRMSADGSQIIGVDVDISAGDPRGVSFSPVYTVAITADGDITRTS